MGANILPFDEADRCRRADLGGREAARRDAAELAGQPRTPPVIPTDAALAELPARKTLFRVMLKAGGGWYNSRMGRRAVGEAFAKFGARRSPPGLWVEMGCPLFFIDEYGPVFVQTTAAPEPPKPPKKHRKK